MRRALGGQVDPQHVSWLTDRGQEREKQCHGEHLHVPDHFPYPTADTYPRQAGKAVVGGMENIVPHPVEEAAA